MLKPFAATSLLVSLACVGALGLGLRSLPGERPPTPDALQPPEPSPRTGLETMQLVESIKDAKPYKLARGGYAVETLDETWRDDARSKDILIRAHIPLGKPGERFPVIVFSHGAGGSRAGYAYLAQHLASHGYLVILPQHADGGIFNEPGSTDKEPGRPARDGADRKTLRDRLRERAKGRDMSADPIDRALGATDDPEQGINRPKDLTFVLDRLPGHPRLGPIADMSHVGAGGHSFGAYTAMALAGLRVTPKGREPMTFGDQRVRCVVNMSGQGPTAMGIDEHSWDEVKIPALLMTGTRDLGPAGRNPAWRHTAYEHLNSADAFFVNIKDANHFTFAMTPREPAKDADARDNLLAGMLDPRHTQWILQTVTAFYDAFVRDDDAAKAWLVSGAIQELSKGEAKFEGKGPSTRSTLGR